MPTERVIWTDAFDGYVDSGRQNRRLTCLSGARRGGWPMNGCREETTHPVTLEIAETWRDGVPSFQARCRFDTLVIADIGTPHATELEAFDVITRALSAG